MLVECYVDPECSPAFKKSELKDEKLFLEG